MNWIQKILDSIASSRNAFCFNQISELQSDLRDAKNTISELEYEIVTIESELDYKIDNYNLIKDKYEALQKFKDELLEELLQYKEKPITIYELPDFLDTTKIAYLPTWKIYYSKNNKMKIKNVAMTSGKFYRIWTDEMYRFFNDKVKGLTNFDEIVVKLRNAVCDITNYESDATAKGKPGENWRIAPETYYGGVSDCEDSTILWLTACNICGIPADRVFNATGYYKHGTQSIGHSFGVAKMTDGAWKVIETTRKLNPIIMKGSKYSMPLNSTLNGLSNWVMSGKSKKEQL